MDPPTILDLNHFCYFEIFKQIKLSCEKHNNASPDEVKYVDLINLSVCNRVFRTLFDKWDSKLAKGLFLLYVSSQENLSIDLAELYERFKGFPEKVKHAYWKSLALAIEENERLASVKLIYHPESHHSEHLDVFETVMNQLRKKKSLRALRMHIAGYTLEDLRGFGNLEELTLDMKTDIGELIRCCRKNGNLYDLSLTNSDTAGRRLAEIVPFCCQVRVFAFKMKYDGNAAEYAPLAKMPRLQKLRIGGEHEQGTLQPLFAGLTRKEPEVLTKLSIDDAPLNWEESTELAQIETLTDLRCGFLQPESIGPLAELNYLNNLEILSSHAFSSISDQIYTVLRHSMRGKVISLSDCIIDYEPGEILHLIVKRGNVSEYSSLVNLPQFEVLKISGFYKPGSLVHLFEQLASVNVSTLIINNDDRDAFLRREGKKRSHLPPLLIDSDDIAALSKCKSLKKIICGLSQAANTELLAKLPELQDLLITHVPRTGSLFKLFQELALAETQVLQHFELHYGTLNSEEVSALSLITTLETLTVSGVGDFGMFSSLEITTSLQKLNIFSYRWIHEVCDDILKVVEVCEARISVSTSDTSFIFDRCNNYLQIMSPGKGKDLDNLIALASLEWVEDLDIEYKECNLGLFFHTLAMKTDGRLKKIRLADGSLDFSETLELANIKTLKGFYGKLTDPRSLDHLRHLNFITIPNFPGNRFPASIVGILDSIDKELTFRLRDREISYNIISGHLTIHNNSPVRVSHFKGKKFYAKRPINDVSDLVPLASLKHLKSVQFFGNHTKGSLQSFFGQLGSRQCQTLQELAMEKENQCSRLVYSTINSTEIREVASIKSLRRLKCGFSEAQNLELLAELPQLTELLITSHQVGSLKDLLAKLSSQSSPTLERLILRDEKLLTPQEKVDLTAIRSLQKPSAACPA